MRQALLPGQVDPKVTAKGEVVPLVEVALELAGPDIVWFPQLGTRNAGGGLRSMFDSWIVSFLEIGARVRRLDSGEGAACTFLQSGILLWSLSNCSAQHEKKQQFDKLKHVLACTHACSHPPHTYTHAEGSRQVRAGRGCGGLGVAVRRYTKRGTEPENLVGAQWFGGIPRNMRYRSIEVHELDLLGGNPQALGYTSRQTREGVRSGRLPRDVG
jgi:hypothetical protein